MDHLSSMDASFLYLETPETPMHVGSLMLFDLPDGYRGDFYEVVRQVIGDRLHLIAPFRRKLAQMPFELSDPIWIDDDDIDLDYHVRHLTLRRPGTFDQLEDLTARLHSTLLDRSRPLWEVYVIDGLENGQIGYYTKAHHSGIDGKAGVELAKVVYDITPEIRKVPPPRKNRRGPNYQLGMAELFKASVSNAVTQYSRLAGILPNAATALSAAANVVTRRNKSFLDRSLALGLSPKIPFNTTITNQRSYTTMSVSLDELKELGKRIGGTVNTIVMAMCSGGLRTFLDVRRELPERSLLAAVPVSLRSEGDNQMNNQVSVVRVDLATDIADPHERFKAIHESSEAAKAIVSELKPVLGLDMPFTGSPWLISGLASMFARSGLPNELPPLAAVLISNVPGIQRPMYLAGARMAHFYPVSIPYHSSAVNITVQSYNGLLDFGITACRRALAQEEARELMGYLRDTLDEIRGFETVRSASAPAEARLATEAEGLQFPLSQPVSALNADELNGLKPVRKTATRKAARSASNTATRSGGKTAAKSATRTATKAARKTAARSPRKQGPGA